MATYPFSIGPLGQMRRLPSPKAKDSVGYTVERSGGIRQTLGGRSTQDTWGTKQVWKFQFSEEFPEAQDFLQRLWRLSTRKPIRFYDPMSTRNLLSQAAANVGADPDRKPLRAFDIGSRTIVWTPYSDVPEDLYFTEGGFQWSVTTKDLLRADILMRVPTHLKQLTHSVYVRGTGFASAVLVPYDAVGTAGTAVEGSEIALNASTWQRVSVTMPANAGRLSAIPALSARAGVVQSVGWQTEFGAVPTPWMVGGSCPQVLLIDHSGELLRMDRRNLDLVLREV